MIVGEISFYGLGPIMILERILNEFAYCHALFYYKEKIDFLNEKYNIDLKFEQDGAKPHTSKSNTILLDKFFGEGNWIQIPPNSYDLEYPIETLWRILKPRIKRRRSKSLEDLKSTIIEEWNSIPENLLKKLFKNYLMTNTF